LGSSNYTASIYVSYTSGTPPPTCTPNWSCSGFGACTNGTQTQTCTDLNACGTTTGRPPLSQSCTATAVPTLTITSPASGATVSGSSLNVLYQYSGLSYQPHLRVVVDAQAPVTLEPTQVTLTYALSNLAAGSHTVQLTLLDNGHQSLINPEATASVTFTVPGACTPNWQCTWSACSVAGNQTCAYADLNGCGSTTGKPADQTRTCTYTPPTAGAPSVSSISGTISHGSTITVSGANFGAKATAAPYVWDDASGPQTATRGNTTASYGPWDFAYPYTNDAAYRLAYRRPSEVTKANGVVGGVALPHNHVTRYLAGAHYNSGSTDTHAGYNVTAGKNNQQGQPYTYISYYVRVDPSWNFESGDHNFKEYDYAAGNGYMGDGPNSYFSLYNINQSNASWAANYIEGMNVSIRSVDTSLVEWYPQYDTVFSKTSAPSPVQAWRKVEFVLKHNDSTDGVHRIFQDNVKKWEVNLDDDGVASPAARAETVFGGYAREAGSSEAYKNNWRYYADIYYDHSWARVILANNANYSAATVVEPQVPNTWSSSSVTAKVNLGKLPDTGTAYLFVFDAQNNRNSTGYPVTLGGATPPPACTPNWSCTAWSSCANNSQTRTCTDTNSCGTTTNKPAESQSCSSTVSPGNEPATFQTAHDTIPNFCQNPTIWSVKSGNWSDATVWDKGRIPGANDIVIVASGHTVAYDVVSSVALSCVGVRGQLAFRISGRDSKGK